ncbi:DUF2179 domain-containing protein, partial [Anaerolineae bacterium CFX9]|nr:DUF2179 domain-containing protein [Anaerolineae bacterium CFX9]
MELVLTPEAILTALLILSLRILNNAVATVRLVTLARGKRLITGVLGFFESLIFAITVGSVVTDLGNVLNMVAYCLGFSLGTWLGMTLEGRFITGHMIVNVFTHGNARDVAQALRELGFGVTETIGEGLHGEVKMLRIVANRRDVRHLLDQVNRLDPSAFVAVEEARSVHRGTIRA